MSRRPDVDIDPELAQQEVPSLHWFDLDRRRFLQLFGGGLAVCVAAPELSAQESGRARQAQELPKDLAAWLHIDKDGKVTVFTGKVEVGQNIRTSLAQQVAEELRVPVDAIRMVMGDTDLCPWDAGTFGSRTTPDHGAAASRRRGRPRARSSSTSRPSAGTSPATASPPRTARSSDPASKRSISYGELTRGEKLLKTLPADIASVAVTPASQWKIAGTTVRKVDGRDFVTGAHKYASDITRPGMLHGKILRPAAFEATLASLDAAKAEALPGVKVVRDGEFVGVVAPDPTTAERALASLASGAKWTEKPGQPSNATIFEYLKKNVETSTDERAAPRVQGDLEQGLASADVKLSQTYTVEYIAHAPLEPRAAVAEWKGDKLTVWTGTQRPFAVREEVATALRIPTENVRVIMPDTGSAYGGKHAGDAAIEAARLSKAAGKPVKVVWTREEEFTWAYLRPAGVIEVRSGARKDGTLVAWEFHNYNSGPAGIATPYDVPNQKIQYHPVKSPLRQGSYRALAATANHFARESHMDELAHELGMDPLAFRHEEPLRPAPQGRLRGRRRQVRLGEAQAPARPRIRHRRRSREGRLHRPLRRSPGGRRAAATAASRSAASPPPSSAAPSSTPTASATRSKAPSSRASAAPSSKPSASRTAASPTPTSPSTASRASPTSPRSTSSSSTARTSRRRERARRPSSESRRRWRRGIFEATGERRRGLPLGTLGSLSSGSATVTRCTKLRSSSAL